MNKPMRPDEADVVMREVPVFKAWRQYAAYMETRIEELETELASRPVNPNGYVAKTIVDELEIENRKLRDRMTTENGNL